MLELVVKHCCRECTCGRLRLRENLADALNVIIVPMSSQNELDLCCNVDTNLTKIDNRYRLTRIGEGIDDHPPLIAKVDNDALATPSPEDGNFNYIINWGIVKDRHQS